jgi:hypothetical protein
MSRGGPLALAYATTMGALFAALQSGCFFELQFRMTAAYPSYLAVTVGWLVGSVAGLRVGRRQDGRGRSAWLAASLAAYYLLLLALRALAYRVEWLPLLGLAIVIMGMQAGHFFAANRTLLPTASRLFLWENNGFVIGWIGAFAGQVALGEKLHWYLPLLLGCGAHLLRRRLFPAPPRGDGRSPRSSPASA